MTSRAKEWIFTEDQRDAVCKGELCPSCLGTNIECRGYVPDGINLNASLFCKDCAESWEGY